MHPEMALRLIHTQQAEIERAARRSRQQSDGRAAGLGRPRPPRRAGMVRRWLQRGWLDPGLARPDRVRTARAGWAEPPVWHA